MRIPLSFTVVPICIFIAHFAPLSGQTTGMNADGMQPDGLAAGYTQAQAGWDEIDSRYFTVTYESEVNLKTVERRLRKRIFFFGRSAPGGMDVNEKIGYRLDTLFDQTRETLDMHPEMPKLKIRIFSDEDDLYAEYSRLTGNSGDVKAFYVHEYGTIYTSEDTMTDSVIVHEIAHAIIDNYFGMIPSSKVAEVLASYVDMHIED